MTTVDEGAMQGRFLVTGALGCIGAWTVRGLIQGGAHVTAFDLGRDARRLRLIMTEEELGKVEFVEGDITDLAALTREIDTRGIDHVIHLAALQVPFCRADPPRGALVNVLGTINVFEAVKRVARDRAMAPIAYTSSVGMFSLEDADPVSGTLRALASAHPINHYGVFKQANEGNARVYWLEDGIPSVGIRPLTVYGVGRDQGMTSGPTKAIVAAVLGRPYTVPFRGPTMYQYAPDVAATLIAASRSALDGAHVFNLPGAVADGPTLAAAIERAVPGGSHWIAFEPVDLPFPSEIDHDGIDVLGELPTTSLIDGIQASVTIYRDLLERGRLDPVEQGLEPAQPTA
jgi:UDP-glucuronate 4-epimerase